VLIDRLTRQSKDSQYTHVHLVLSQHADLMEDFCRDRLPFDDIFVSLQEQPLNPEDEESMVPAQHAAFGIQRATQRVREPAWRDLGLAELMRRGPVSRVGGSMNLKTLPR
jgi:hypothetical protein